MNAGILIIVCCMSSFAVMFSQYKLCGPMVMTFGPPKKDAKPTNNTCRNIHGIISCTLCLLTFIGMFLV